MDKQPQEIWLRTDEIEEFIAGLEHCAELSTGIQKDVMKWKWLLLALHNTVQGACTCALRGVDTTGLSVLTKNSAKAVWHWLDVESRKTPHAPMPREKLAPMTELFARTRSATYLEIPHRLPEHPQRDIDVNKLNDLRNEFSHFVPKGFSLEVSGMPRMVCHSCDAIEHLAVKYPTFWRHVDSRNQSRIKKALESIRLAMRLWVRTYLQAETRS